MSSVCKLDYSLVFALTQYAVCPHFLLCICAIHFCHSYVICSSLFIYITCLFEFVFGVPAYLCLVIHIRWLAFKYACCLSVFWMHASSYICLSLLIPVFLTGTYASVECLLSITLANPWDGCMFSVYMWFTLCINVFLYNPNVNSIICLKYEITLVMLFPSSF